ncbi:outer membrane lipoprotein [Klebsiella pneumoniae]|uniref:Outer membrane lipoprotein n=1 Tax=Klebsiella pneumoniae TaxID=573 RepID=A0A2X3FE60_KLEPN|nr:outer membrane lipoprotein [Klebsiella pneumoniae]
MAARLSRIIPVSLTLLAAMALSACTSQQAPALKEGEKPVDVGVGGAAENAGQRQGSGGLGASHRHRV